MSREELEGAVTLTSETQSLRFLMKCSRSHPQAGVLGAAGSIRADWPAGSDSIVVSTNLPVSLVRTSLFRPRFGTARAQATLQVRPDDEEAEGCTVIIPVYEGRETSCACIDSVIKNSPQAARIVIVDDHTPDHELAAALDRYRVHSNVELIRNPVNLGFIASVNRALTLYPRGHVVLLNADTRVPEGWLPRLWAHASRDPSIGTSLQCPTTVELTSAPREFASSPFHRRRTLPSSMRFWQRNSKGSQLRCRMV